jgi:hypothetical protein
VNLLARGTDPDPSIGQQKSIEKRCVLLLLSDFFFVMNDVNVPSANQRYGSADPDPYQYVTDPEH